MLIVKKFTALFLIVTAILCLPARATIYDDVGTGSSVSYLYLQFAGPTPENVLISYHYNYIAGDQLNGASLLVAISNLTPSLQIAYSGTPSSSSFFLYEITYNGYTLPTYTETANYSWTYFVSGGSQLAYDENFMPVTDGNGHLVYDPVPTGSWSFANAGASDRLVSPGSWDGWVFGEYSNDWSSYVGALPDITPVPEPETLLFLGLATISLCIWRPRKNQS